MTKEEAIDNLQDLWNEVYNEDSDGYNYAVAIDMAIEALSDEPKKGEWKIDEYGIYHCPYCNAINNTVYKSFCPNCGADMRGGTE